MTDRVSVIIPTYNVAATIERAIASVLQQTHAPHEILCIDDCSTDNAHELLKQQPRRHPLQPSRKRSDRLPPHTTGASEKTYCSFDCPPGPINGDQPHYASAIIVEAAETAYQDGCQKLLRNP